MYREGRRDGGGVYKYRGRKYRKRNGYRKRWVVETREERDRDGERRSPRETGIRRQRG
jgi:hypothetical protein